MKIKKIKSILKILSLSFLGITSLYLTVGIFKHEIFSTNPWINLLIISAIFAIAPIIALTELGILTKKKIIGIISLSFLALSTLLTMLMAIIPNLINVDLYVKITVSLILSSILLSIILSNYAKLERKAIALQVVTYSVLSIFIILSILAVFGIPVYSNVLELMLILIISSVALLISLIVVGNKKTDTEPSKNDEIITIKKAEYENLKNEILRLKTENSELKEKLKNFENL